MIEGVEVELRNYAERLSAGDATLLEESEDEGAAGFAGEELRRFLQRAIEEGELGRLQSLPWGIGAAFEQGPGVPSTGAQGIFFACRTSSGERYWRYVSAEGSVIDSEAELLRRIDAGDAPSADPASTPIDLESAWQAAVSTIVEDHGRRADPRIAEERIGPAQRFALEVLRDPAVALPAGADDAEQALSVERATTVRQALGEVRRLAAEGALSRVRAAERIVEVVGAFGLQPVEAAPVLNEIEESDVGVVCWMVVLPTP